MSSPTRAEEVWTYGVDMTPPFRLVLIFSRAGWLSLGHEKDEALVWLDRIKVTDWDLTDPSVLS
jgi:hypothetical protein